jgi:hypothetical protein
MKVFHWTDTMVLVDPTNFPARLRNAGLAKPTVELADRSLRFWAVHP